MHHRRRPLAALAAVPLLAGAVSCGGGGGGDAAPSGPKAAREECGALPTADPAAKLPAGFPLLDGALLYEQGTQGKTLIVNALVAGTDFVKVRDGIVADLEAASYRIEGTDQESVEAEAEYSGPHRGTIKVEPLCKGYLTIRYKVLG